MQTHSTSIEILTKRIQFIEQQMKSLAFAICNDELSGIKMDRFCETMIPPLEMAKKDYIDLQKERLSIKNTINFLMEQDFGDQNNE